MSAIPASPGFSYNQPPDAWVILQHCNQLLNDLNDARIDYEKAVGPLCNYLKSDISKVSAFAKRLLVLDKNNQSQALVIASMTQEINNLDTELLNIENRLKINVFLLLRLEKEQQEFFEIQTEQARLDLELSQTPLEEMEGVSKETGSETSNWDRTLEDVERELKEIQKETKDLSARKEQMEARRCFLSNERIHRSHAHRVTQEESDQFTGEFFRSCSLPQSPNILEIIRKLWS